MMSIAGKKILFFSPAFFGYEEQIANKMEELGAIVDRYDERSVTSSFERACLKISPRIFERKSCNYYKKIISENRRKKYNYILIINCDMTPKNMLKKMKMNFPNAKMCLYLWDSIENIPGIMKKLQFFDSIHSFDYDNCIRYPMLKFRPLFYADPFCQEPIKNKDYKYDISFCGTIHSDRFAVIRQMQDIARCFSLKGYWYCYLQSKFIYYFYKMVKKEFSAASQHNFIFVKKSSEQIAQIAADSRAILDIQHPKQNGLTMRTIEIIGMNKKLITTNAAIKNYDFYNANNILVVNRKQVQMDLTFFEKPYIPLNNEVYEKYSLKNWILELLDQEK